MSHKGHPQPRTKKDKDHAVVGRQDPRLVERQQERRDPVEPRPRRQSRQPVPKS